jgi:intein-encoded DNA endonuclease-like protein
MELIETKEKFIEMRAQGYSYDKISKQLKICKQTLIDWSKDLEEEISNRKALELEALYEKYYLLKENRIQTLGELLSKVKEEISKRDFSDIPAEKLLDILLKYETLLRDEIVDPVFRSSGEIAESKEDRELLESLTVGLKID